MVCSSVLVHGKSQTSPEDAPETVFAIETTVEWSTMNTATYHMDKSTSESHISVRISSRSITELRSTQ